MVLQLLDLPDNFHTCGGHPDWPDAFLPDGASAARAGLAGVDVQRCLESQTLRKNCVVKGLERDTNPEQQGGRGVCRIRVEHEPAGDFREVQPPI